MEEKRIQVKHSEDQLTKYEVKNQLALAEIALWTSTIILFIAFLIIPKVNGASYSMFIILIPALIISSGIICCISYMICCFRVGGH
mmetsp:Transcript_11743/g.17518  ORF Transcript_11743/g.17518 Transcript_11743/m.17518 type:complete len:86 (-) Transcript_11743:92-349(-)